MARPKGYRLSRAAWDDLIAGGSRKLTVTEVAAATGIQSATISNIISGNTGASLAMARRLCDGIGVSVETLFPATDRTIVDDVLSRTEQAA